MPCPVPLKKTKGRAENQRRWRLSAVAWAAAATLAAALAGCAAPLSSPKAAPAPAQSQAATPAEASGEMLAAFTLHSLPGNDGVRVPTLQRAERTAPARYRVIVLPGSGCAGMAPVAARYFAGLLHAQVLVLHKPWADPHSRTPPGQCSAAFVQADALGAWRDHALAALRADTLQRLGKPVLPQVLVGISEGAELLPFLAAEVPHLAAVVLVGSSGLNPREAGALQAQRLGASRHWQALGTAQASALPDSQVLQGRSLRYWRDLWHWPLAAPLQAGHWPLLQVWGANDALVPAAAYARFAAQIQNRSAPHCMRRLPGADHGLQRPDADGVQQLWAWLEQWARAPKAGVCSAPDPGK